MEEIKSITPNLRENKVFGAKTYNVILTDKRLVFAQVTSQMIKQETQKARQDAKNQGKGFFGKWASQIGAAMSFSERYKDMPVDDILDENPGNFYIDRNQIRKVKVRSVDDTNNYRVIIKTTGGKYKFNSKTYPKELKSVQ